MVQSSDRNGTVHQDSYDVLGRLTADNVTSFGVGVDATIQQLTYGYDSQGNLSLITSLKAGGTIANQVRRFFNGLGQLTTEYQAHNGEVNLPNTPGVQYAYNEMSNGANNSRLVGKTYPDGYFVSYNPWQIEAALDKGLVGSPMRTEAARHETADTAVFRVFGRPPDAVRPGDAIVRPSEHSPAYKRLATNFDLSLP